MTLPLQPISQQQRDTIQRLSPTQLARGVGERLLYAIGLGSDVILEKRNQGVHATFPLYAPPSALPLLGDDLVLTQGAGESNAAFAVRLSNANEAWGIAGNRWSILEQVQGYFATPSPIYSSTLAEAAIVGGNSTTSTWDTIYTTDVPGAPPGHAQITPANWNWDGKNQHWRSWLILYEWLLPVGLSGTAATVSATGGGTSLGQLVNGVWVPGTTPTGTSTATITGLTGMSAANVQEYLTLSGAGSAGNNGTFQIVAVPSATSAVVANTGAAFPDGNSGAIVWSVGRYPGIDPGPTWGAPGYLWGDTTRSWGLSCTQAVIDGLRSLLRQWKSANTYYPYIIVSFGPVSPIVGSEFSPSSSQGAGNPDGTWGSPGKVSAAGVWVPARLTGQAMGAFDGFCDGTGLYVNCNVHNVT